MSEIAKALEALQLNSANASQATQAVNILAGASKRDFSIRQQLANPQVLKTLIEIIDTSLNDSLETVDLALRCIGNASINNSAARETLTNIGFSWASRCLNTSESRDVTTLSLAAKVLYNICCDYEPAQQQCFNEHIHYALIHLCVSSTTVQSEDQALFIELLFWFCSQKAPDSTATDPLPEAVLSTLISLPGLYYRILDPEDFAMLLETCLLYLRDTQVQKDVVMLMRVNLVWHMLQQNEDKIANLGPNDDEDSKLLVTPSVSLIWCLSDMAARSEFPEIYTMRSQFVEDVVYVVKTSSSDVQRPRLITAACHIIGNLLWSLKDTADIVELVEAEELHSPILGILNSSHDAELLHSAAGLLIQLTRAVQVRETIGNAYQTRPALERLCRNETPQLKQDGIKLLKALGRECPAN